MLDTKTTSEMCRTSFIAIARVKEIISWPIADALLFAMFLHNNKINSILRAKIPLLKYCLSYMSIINRIYS